MPASSLARPGARCIGAVQILQQADARTDRPVRELLMGLSVLRRPVTAVYSIAEVIVGFSQGRFGDSHVSSKFWMPVTGESLGEVARGRRGRIVDLFAEPAIIASR